MLKNRIIPTLLWDGVQCVKPVSFERPYRKLGSMEQYIQVMERRNIDELIILDIEATAKNRPPDFDKLRTFCNNLYCPVTYGGGISSLDHIRDALSNGADKVAIRHRLDIVPQAVKKFGAQAIVGVLEFCEQDVRLDNSAIYLESIGVGEILLTDANRDGMMEGYNLDAIEIVSQAVNIPIIANGGCGEPVHMLQALEAGASAVAAGSMFLYTEFTPRDCARDLIEWGQDVRLV